MSESGDTDIEELIKPLREAYALRLPGHMQAMHDLLTCIEAGHDRREELRTLAHRLRGTAGSYGFGAVGQEFAKVDELIRARGAGPLSTEHIALMRKALREAASALDP